MTVAALALAAALMVAPWPPRRLGPGKPPRRTRRAVTIAGCAVAATMIVVLAPVAVSVAAAVVAATKPSSPLPKTAISSRRRTPARSHPTCSTTLTAAAS